MHAAIVIPVGAGRLANLNRCLRSVMEMKDTPELIVLVGDGPEATREAEMALDEVRHLRTRNWVEVEVVEAPKHEPGLDHPRNRGVRHVQEVNHHNAILRQGYQQRHVWFLDSDLIVNEDAYTAYKRAHASGGDRILIGPYDFMPPGNAEPMPDYYQDMRWESFKEHEADEILENDLSAGLACFSGNLVWPIDEFVRVGGFWAELHHGRCEDGELGLRAVACGVPISFVRDARAWHVWHGADPAPTAEWMQWATGVNAIDVPKIDARHPWLHGKGLFVVEEDGKRFDIQCRCGWSGNTAEIWNHKAVCDAEPMPNAHEKDDIPW